MASEGGGEPSFADQVDVQYGGRGRFFEAKYNFQNNQNYISINVDKLDTILSDNNINHIDLMVLDVEGYEENVLHL